MAIQRKYKVLLKTVGIVILGIVSGVIYVYNKPHRDIAGEKPAYELSASDFFDEWTVNEDSAHAKFDNQVIQLTGVVTNKAEHLGQYTLNLLDEMETVECTIDSLSAIELENILSSKNTGDSIIIKGRCDGIDYDPDMYEMLGKRVILSECTVIK